MARQRKALERRRDTVVKTMKREIEIHLTSADFSAISEVVGRFGEAEPPEAIKDEMVSLTKRHQEMLDAAKSKLKELAKAEHPKLIDDEIYEYAAYTIADEREECARRRAELIAQARAEIEVCINAADSETTIADCAGMLTKYEDYPRELEKTKNLLKRKHTNAVRVLEREIRGVMASKDIAEVDETLKKHLDAEGKPLEHVADVLSELDRHRRRLSVSMSDQLMKALGQADPSVIDEVLARAEPFGEELSSEREQLTTHRKSLLEDMKAKIDALKSGEDFSAIEKSLEAAKDAPEDMKADYDALEQHRTKLVETSKTELAKLKESADPKEISDGLATWQVYAPHVRDTIDDVRRHRVDLLDTARDEISRAGYDREASISSMREVVDKYESYPADIEGSLNSLKATLRSSIEKAERECKAAMKSEDAGQIDAALERYAESGDDLIDQMAQLKAQRKSMSSILIAKLQSRKASSDVEEIQVVLALAEQFEADTEVAEPLRALQEHLKSLHGDMGKKLEDAATKGDPVEIMAVMAEAAPYLGIKAVSEKLTVAQNALRDVQVGSRGRCCCCCCCCWCRSRCCW